MNDNTVVPLSQVPRDVTEDMLRPFFEPYGEIEHINILRTQRGQSAGVLPSSIVLCFPISALIQDQQRRAEPTPYARFYMSWYCRGLPLSQPH